MPVKSVSVVGAGQMGAGIAQVAAASGYDVVLHDLEKSLVDKGLDTIRKSLAKFVEKGKMTREAHDATWSRIRPTTRLDDCTQADLVVEAVVEKADVKKDVFRRVDAAAPPTTILATNTSSIPITELAAATHRPDRFIGMHFMNPVPLMQLVEVIRGLETSAATKDAVFEVSRKMGKTPIEVHDAPGFAINRFLIPMLNEAFWAVQQGVASFEDIDQGAKLGLNHPMGPFELADFVGLDTCLYVLEVLHEGFGDPKFAPCPLLRKYVQAGRLGRKTGRGVYDYSRK